MRRVPFIRLATDLRERYDILCVDTEFTRLPNPKEAVWSWAVQAKVLSIGIAALDGRAVPATFYGVRRLSHALKSLCTDFVISEVVPALAVAPADIEAQTDRDLVASLDKFLRQRAAASGKPPLLAIDWLGDAYLIEAFSGREHEWLLLDDMAPVAAALGECFPASSVRHNALHDAASVRSTLNRIMNFHGDLLHPEQMQAVRDRLATVSWYTHFSSVPASFRKIQIEGLRPCYPGGTTPDEVLAAMGDGGRRILCLYPVGASIVQLFPSQPPPPLFMAVVRGVDLPAKLGLDWSYDYNWNLGMTLRCGSTQSNEDIVFEVALRSGSIACYEGVAPEHLRVKAKHNTDEDFDRWPNIQDVTENDLFIWPPSNVW